MSADMSVLGNLCRSLYLGSARLFRGLLFLVLALISILSLVYLSKVGCRFQAPLNPVVGNTTSNSKNSEIAAPDNSMIFGSFDPNMCLVLNIYHCLITLPVCIIMVFYLIASTFCFKHYRNNVASYVSNHKRELAFLIMTSVISLISFSMSCLLERLVVGCGPCKDPTTQNKFGKIMSLIVTINWFATFLWIGLTGVGITTFCIFKELVKTKDSEID